MEKVIIYGCGGNYRYALLSGMIDSYDVVAYSDSNPKLWGLTANDSEVIPPEKINDYFYDAVYVTSEIHFEDIADTLKNRYGVPARKIKLLKISPLEDIKYKKAVNKPDVARRYLKIALNDERLEDEHKEFLKEVTYDEKGYPMWGGKNIAVLEEHINYGSDF